MRRRGFHGFPEVIKPLKLQGLPQTHRGDADKQGQILWNKWLLQHTTRDQPLNAELQGFGRALLSIGISLHNGKGVCPDNMVQLLFPFLKCLPTLNLLVSLTAIALPFEIQMALTHDGPSSAASCANHAQAERKWEGKGTFNIILVVLPPQRAHEGNLLGCHLWHGAAFLPLLG